MSKKKNCPHPPEKRHTVKHRGQGAGYVVSTYCWGCCKLIKRSKEDGK